MKNGKMEVVIFQGNPKTIDLTYEEMENRWKENLDRVPEIGGYRVIDSTDRWMTAEDYDRCIGDADAAFGIWIHKGVINEELFCKHPKLKYVATLGHGFEEFDVEMTHRHGVTITNTIYGDVTIAEYAMALLMNICHHVTLQSDYSKKEYWKEKEMNPEARYGRLLAPQIELYEKTMGIIGLGSIGLWTAKMAKGFGMHVVANSRHKKEGPQYEGIEQTSLDEVLKRSDVISIHCPYTEETRHLLDAEAFQKMKDGVILINTARGLIIDEDALLHALESRKVYMAGLDVVANEPPQHQIPLMQSPYTFITSHIAWQPKSARLRAVDMAVSNYCSYLHGCPVSVINL